MSSKLKVAEHLNYVMEKQYYQDDETKISQIISRVTKFVANGELGYGWTNEMVQALQKDYYDTIMQRLWIPSSPFLMNAGTKVPMLSACFVEGGLKDDLESIFETLKKSANVWKMGGGTGFNFSELREKGAKINSSGGVSSGVMSWMDIFDVSAEKVKQGGKRRSVNMGILKYNHPDIMEFINCKLDLKKLNNFNISVLLDDEFMRKVEANEYYDLISPSTKEIVGSINARDVFMNIMENGWASGEPSIIWVDSINKDNPMLKYLGEIITTNPCGEVTLYFYEACNLASVNLEEFVGWDGIVDKKKLKKIVRLVTRFLDTAIDVNELPDAETHDMVHNLRRLGIGIMSLHGALIKAGLKYSSHEGREFAGNLMHMIYDFAWEASQELAVEKGTFPYWHHSEFYVNDFRVRNVACTTIAPTGTIQQIVNTSSAGGEPIYALVYMRTILGEEKLVINPFFKEVAEREGFWSDDLPMLIFDNGGGVKGISQVPMKWQELFETASEISPKDHVLMQASLQKFVDNSISKTINMSNDATVRDVYDAYMLGFKSGLKGMTIYRDGSRGSQVLKGKSNNPIEKPELKRGEIIKAPEMSDNCRNVKLYTGCGSIYLTMTKDENGDIVQTFVDKGSKGTCISNQVAVSRLVSVALRGGIPVNDVIDQLISIPVCPSYYGHKKCGERVSKGTSCPSAIAHQLKEYAELNIPQPHKEQLVEKFIKEIQNESVDDERELCPECHKKVRHEGGCTVCSCGFSKCG